MLFYISSGVGFYIQGTRYYIVLLRVFMFQGLAGVYHITDHYQFEYNRGVEDISSMARTMYGKENFDRFSPTVIVHSLPKGTR